MKSIQTLKSNFNKFYKKVKENLDIGEDELRVIFTKSGILASLGYSAIGRDIRVEKSIKRKRSDLYCTDDYCKVNNVIELKKPREQDLERYFDQLWDNYVIPLKAKYGILTNGLELILYKRVNSNSELVLKKEIKDLSLEDYKIIYDSLKKPHYDISNANAIYEYIKEFQTKESRVNLSTETSQKHFFDNFELEVDSVFGNLLYSTINLFNCKYGVSPFLTGAYDFWKKSYGIRPKDIPQKWKKIFEYIGLNQYDTSDLCKFMFCLETSYAFFTHLVLIKACADYRFTGVDLFTFIKNEIENSSRGNEIPIVSWATLSVKLIDTMQVRLIKSVF
ncbi:MAG: type I restriction enzyme HsdR N-terminal domain-containing protein, partial [Methanosarcinales archaeon]